jgi:uncharacterized membrane protein YhaH (DUF805 family)
MNTDALFNLLLSIKGRANRKQFWLVTLGVTVFAMLVIKIDMWIGNAEPSFLSYAAVFLIWWPSLVIQIKRWHDRDKSGWWALVNLIPVIGALWIIVECGILPGTPGSNRFGDVPGN